MMTKSPQEAAEMVLAIADGEPITITGGEPFDQAYELGLFVKHLRNLPMTRPGQDAPHIIVYTGHLWPALYTRAYGPSDTGGQPDNVGFGINLVLTYASVLVDGPYMAKLDSPYVQWRGSLNQRVIDLSHTRTDASIVDRAKNPHFLDWDTPAFEVINGEVYLTNGLYRDLSEQAVIDGHGLDAFQVVPRCGQY